MSEYLEARREAVSLLGELLAVHEEYRRIARDGGAGAQRQLIELVQQNSLRLREGVEILGNDPRMQMVISAEPALLQQASELGNFWMYLQQSKLIPTEDDRPPQEAKTRLPPEPAEEITGATVLRYMQELDEWLRHVSQDLWGDDYEVDFPVLGNRYGIGDFGQTLVVADVLREGMGLKHHWIQVASCGAYWDTVSVGAARAKLIFKGLGIMERLLHPGQ